MFDPTAYENIKVVFEGIVYDFDLDGDITILERNDIVNLANMSRVYNLLFVNKKDKKQQLKMKMEIDSSIHQLASEWYPLGSEPGASLTIQYIIQNPLNEILEKRISKFIKQTYSKNYDFSYVKQIDQDQVINFYFKVQKIDDITEHNLEQLPQIVHDTIEIGKELLKMV